VVPGFVHWQLGYNAVLAGLAISAQYVATLFEPTPRRRMGDSVVLAYDCVRGCWECHERSRLVGVRVASGDPMASFGVCC